MSSSSGKLLYSSIMMIPLAVLLPQSRRLLLNWSTDSRCRSQIDFLPVAGDGDELDVAEQELTGERFRALEFNDA